MKCPACNKNIKDDLELMKHTENNHPSLFKSLVNITHNPKKFEIEMKKILNKDIDEPLLDELDKQAYPKKPIDPLTGKPHRK